ncbi:hypothetical protein CO251_08200 [Sulfobacillus sp. hq2]|nr:hypothetical protein CO251_08200 [Sulfobacillus sp. hq2]
MLGFSKTRYAHCQGDPFGMPLYIILMLMAGISYGLVTPLAKLGIVHDVPVAWLTLAQYPVSLIIFHFGKTMTSSKVIPRWQDHLTMIAIGALGAGVSLTYYRSLTFLPGSIGIVLLFQFTWMLPLLSGLLHHHWPTRCQRYGIAAVLAGTFLAGGIVRGSLPLEGFALGLASALLYALTLLLSGRINAAISPWYRSEISLASGLLLISIAYQPWHNLQWAIDPSTWVWGSLMGLFSQAIPLLFTYISAPQLPPALTGMLASSELPVAVILSAVWLNETVSIWRWIGVAIILAGILIGSVPLKRLKHTSPL